MPTANWKRLGEQLVRRRIEIDPRYFNRRLFARERGVNIRTVSDIERGRRDNYEDGTITALEVAYAVRAGSIRRAVAEDADLEPLAEPPAGPAHPAAPPAAEAEEVLARLLAAHPGDEVIQAIGAPAGPQAQKPAYEVVGEILKWLERQGDPGAAEAERARLAARYPADKVLQVINRQSGKRSWMVTVEMLDWLASQGPAVPQARDGTAG